jgi:hypothetical protein
MEVYNYTNAGKLKNNAEATNYNWQASLADLHEYHPMIFH